ncbi:hypothetical protein D3C75_439030 [compost metagenome]
MRSCRGAPAAAGRPGGSCAAALQQAAERVRAKRRDLFGQQLEALVLLLHLGAQGQQRTLLNQAAAAFPHLWEQHDLAALDLVLPLDEGHRLAGLGRNFLNGYDHSGRNRLALIRGFAKVHQPLDARLLKQGCAVVQRMAGQVEAEQLTLQLQLLGDTEFRNIRVADFPVRGFDEIIEQLDLQLVALLAPLGRGIGGLIEHSQQLGPVPGQTVKGAGLEQGFNDPLVADA